MRRDKQSKNYNAHNAKPFVGYVSSGNTIELLSRNADLICRPTTSSNMVLWFIVIMIVTSAAAASQSPEVARLKNFMHFSIQEQVGHVVIGFFILFLVGAVLVFAIEKLLFFGVLIVDSAGVLRFCQGFQQREIRVIRPGEIEGLKLSQVSFQGKHQTYINHLLILQLQNGEEVVLSASPENELISKLRDEICRRAGIAMDSP